MVYFSHTARRKFKLRRTPERNFPMKRTNQFARTDRDIVNAFLTLLDQKSFE